MSIRLVLGGDVMLGRLFNDIFNRDPSFDPWGNTRTLTNTADIFSANLETTITNSNKKWPDKTFNYKMLPQYAYKLKTGNLSYVSLANNHILDYRKQGLLDTMKNLNKIGVWYSGAGGNLNQAQNSISFKIDKPDISMRVNYLSAANHYKEWAAGPLNEGIWYIDIENWSKQRGAVLQRIQQVRTKCDILVLNMHFGPNWIDTPSVSMKQFAHDVIKAGVDILQGHSAHHVLPLEIVEREINIKENIKTERGIVFYSLGDLIDDYAINKKYRNDLGLLCSVDIDKDLNKTVRLFPTRVRDFRVNLLENQEEDYQSTLDRVISEV